MHFSLALAMTGGLFGLCAVCGAAAGPDAQYPDYKPDAVLAAKGAAAFGFNCGICHGPAAVSGGTAPDLRSSDIVSATDTFRAVVHDGTRVAAGMPSFNDLSDSDIAAIRQYIRSQAADLRAGKAKSPASVIVAQ